MTLKEWQNYIDELEELRRKFCLAEAECRRNNLDELDVKLTKKEIFDLVSLCCTKRLELQRANFELKGDTE